MIVAPIETLDLMISDIVSEVRKGISGARIANQINPDAGMMADLPEFIEFEVQVIGNYRTSANVVISGRQILSRSSDSLDVGQTFDGSGEVEGSTESEVGSEVEESRDADRTTGVTRTSASNDGKDTEGESKDGRSQKGSRNQSSSRSSSRSNDTSTTLKEDVDSEKAIDSSDETKSGKRDQVGVGQGTRNQKKNLKVFKSRNANTASNAARGYGTLETETGVFTGQGSFINPYRNAPIAGEAECNPP